MPGHKIIFISCAVRGDIGSALRRDDVSVLRGVIDQMKKECRQNGATDYPAAPYLLHAQTLTTQKELSDYRVRYATQLDSCGAVPHTEVHLHGEVLVPEMLVEAEEAEKRGLRVVVCNEVLKQSLVMTPISRYTSV